MEREIIPRYASFNKAHQENHVRMVIEQSLRLAEHTPSMNSDMVYVIAAFHDLGLINGRENHHKDSRKILEADEFVKSHFSRKQIIIMGRAVEDHRASNQKKPRNGYGLLVAEADLQLLSGLLFAVQIGRAENLQLLEIKFPYFNCLSHEKS